MADLNSISRLQEEQQKTLKDCELMIAKWEKFKEDYVSVDNLLSELPKKTTHEVMVPIGPLAFMPGNLIHTNEIMVLLGDNWFAERSASQAVDIAKRRLKNVEDYLKNLHEEHKNILSHIAFTSDISSVKGENDFQEIKEELSEEDKKILGRKTNRVAYSRATKDSVKKVDLRNFTKGGNSQKCTNDDDLFARLDELEEQERIKNEIDNVTNEEQIINIDEDVNLKVDKKVKWKENIVEEKEIETVAVPNVEKATITFSHSTKKVIEEKDTNKADEITSPADIFTHYLTKKAFKGDTVQQPRSILKHSNNNEREEKIPKKESLSDSINTVNGGSLKENPKIVSKLEDIKPAFSDVVLEHKDVGNPDVPVEKEQQCETRKVSKFKARRMNTME